MRISESGETEFGGGQTLVDALTNGRKFLMWAGVLLIVLGGLALLTPTASSIVVEFLVGVFFLLGGIVTLASVFSLRGTGWFFAAIFSGALMLLAGLFLLADPARGLLLLTMVIAVVFISNGLFQFVLALQIRPQGNWVWLLLSALVSLLLGGLVALGLPDASRFVLGVLVGVDFLTTGVAFVMLARGIAMLED